MIRTLRIIALAVLLTLSASYPPGLRAQQKGFTVQGVVTDTEGESLIGVFISVKGTKTGTTTDLDGRYSLHLSGPATLVFQYMGMENQEVAVNQARTLDITMKGDNTLEEVVISAGYGLAQKRSDMTGSAFQVASEQLKTLPATRVDNLLQGMVPGLAIDESTNSAARTR